MDQQQRIEHDLTDRFGTLLEWVRLLRKWRETADSECHRERLRLERRVIFKQLTRRDYEEPAEGHLSQAVEQFLLQQFPGLPHAAKVEGSWRSLFLGWELSAVEIPTALVLPNSLLILLSILPDFGGAPVEWRRELYKFRRDGRVADAFVAVAAQEFLVCLSASRSSNSESAELTAWMQFLRDEISVVDCEMASALRLENSEPSHPTP